MADANSRIQELVSSKELPFHSEPSLSPLQINFSQVSRPPPTGRENDSDSPYSSSESSPSQSRTYMRAGLDISFTDFHRSIAASHPLTQRDADIPNSASDSPSQSRQYMREGLPMSFANFHRDLARGIDQEGADLNEAAVAAAEAGLIEQNISSSSADTSLLPTQSPSSPSNLWSTSPIARTQSPVDINHNPSRRRPSDLYRWVTHGIPLPELELPDEPAVRPATPPSYGFSNRYTVPEPAGQDRRARSILRWR